MSSMPMKPKREIKETKRRTPREKTQTGKLQIQPAIAARKPVGEGSLRINRVLTKKEWTLNIQVS